MQGEGTNRPALGADISKETLAMLGAPDMVYVREVAASELRAEGILPVGMSIAKDARFFAVHLANGQRVAIHDNRDGAFAAAREHDLSPVSVH